MKNTRSPLLNVRIVSRRCLILLFLVLSHLGFSTSLSADEFAKELGNESGRSNFALNKATEASTNLVISELAQSFTWRKMIQAGRDGRGGDLAIVLSDDFYLSDTKPLDVEAEMRATMRAFSTNQLIGERNTPAACQFPARFLWLEREFPEQAKRWHQPECEFLDLWVNFDDFEGISLIQVSGFLGNPASAFGHLLLQVNREGSVGLRGLQDIGVNFGAVVPEGEHPIAYVLKGLFGDYEAGFSGQEFYTQDYVYSSTEFRDMWAYELNLTRFQEKMILYTLWELKEALFKYYFLRINCAFHLAQIMEIALETDFGLGNEPWYLPVSLFHTLKAIDAKQSGSLIKSVEFIPSMQREVHLSYSKLSKGDKQFANRYAVANQHIDLPESASSSLLDFLLLYVDYRAQNQKEYIKEQWKARRSPILVARMQQPVVSTGIAVSRFDDEIYAPAANSPKSRKFALGLDVDRQGSTTSTLVAAPYAYDVLNRNTGSLIDSTFRLGETRLSFSDDEEVFLESFELLTLEKLAPPVSSLASEQKLNWRSSIGVKRFERRCESCLSPVISGGIGKAKRMGASLNVYGYATAELNRLGADVGVAVGGLWQMLPRVRWRFESHAQLRSSTDGFIGEEAVLISTLSSLVNFGQNWDVSFNAEHTTETNEAEALMLVNFRW